MTPYKSMPKWGCDRIEAQERFTHSHSHLLQSMVGYDCGHLFASVHYHLVSRYARRLAPSSPSCPLLAVFYVSAVCSAENAMCGGVAVSNPRGGRRIPWPKKGGKASISPGFSASGLPC